MSEENGTKPKSKHKQTEFVPNVSNREAVETGAGVHQLQAADWSERQYLQLTPEDEGLDLTTTELWD